MRINLKDFVDKSDEMKYNLRINVQVHYINRKMNLLRKS